MNKKLLILFLCVLGFQPFINAVDLNQIVQRQEVDNGAPVLSVTDDNSMVNRALKTLWVGFEYTSEQKDTIRKEIVELERQKAVIKGWITDLLTGPAKTFPTEDYLQNKLKEVEEKIYKKKLAIGDAWSPARKTFVLATVAALGFGVFKYLQPATIMSAVNASQVNGDNSDNRIFATQSSENVSTQRPIPEELPEIDRSSEKVIPGKYFIEDSEDLSNADSDSESNWQWFWRSIVGAELSPKQ